MSPLPKKIVFGCKLIDEVLSKLYKNREQDAARNDGFFSTGAPSCDNAAQDIVD